jgi:hypothetical protein
MKDDVSRSFEPRHVIPDTRISSGQCPRCDVNVTLGARDLHAVREISKVTRNKRAVRHIHINIRMFHCISIEGPAVVSQSHAARVTRGANDSVAWLGKIGQF